MTWSDARARAHSVRRRPAALIALAAMIVIGTTGTGAERRAARARTLTMTATAYCEGGKTKSGTQVKSGTVAADPRVLPIGTTIRVVGLKSRRPETFTVADTGVAVKGNHIDIFISDCARAKIFGRQRVQVRVLP
jgi:3D (Asp-Asp-Asp) domain-containing protein